MFLRSISMRGGFRQILTAAALVPLALAFGAHRAAAADLPPLSLLSPGDAVVTGFSGILPPTPPLPPGVDPIDETFINLDGASMQIQRLQPNGPPAGQLIPSPTIFTARARDVGQVFPITFDDALAPNIYLGATSAFGLQIVVPDADGDGRPERVKTGQPGASFMEGQWGPGGTAGSIYRVDGTTGAISLFTTIGANAGPGLGDVVFDRTSHQFFVSDLDTGLIYRLDSTGLVTDTFDHGVNGRPHHSLAPVADDGSVMNITDPAFNTEDPATWGYTQKERMVWGMAMHGGRLYYAVADGPQIWSVGINLDGSFADDARWEVDVTGLASADPVSDMAFDNQGRMILAQRGAQHGSYDYTVFAEPNTASVVRYTREVPDDPATPGIWVPVPDQYAIGFRPDGHNSTGGISLGYGYDANGYMRSCGEFLWSTGDSLRDNPALASQLAANGPAIVHGLQGNDKELVRPANDPPFSSYFTDYDGNYDDPANQGHTGDVEIFQSCGGQGYGYIPPYYPPPGYTPGTFNLTLDKIADPYTCIADGGGWVCSYTIRVTNTGTTPYWGPLSIYDSIPDLPPGASVNFASSPPWTCTGVGPTDFQCDYPPVFLYPGDSVDLYAYVDLPQSTNLCYLDNTAQIYWPPGYGDQNPADDYAWASAQIPAGYCPPPNGPKTNLKIEKRAVPDICWTVGTNWVCTYDIKVTNAGPGVYSGNIQVTDTLSVATPIIYSAPWACVGAPPTHTCTYPGANLNPGQSVHLWIQTSVPKADQEQAGKCTVENRAKITFAPGGSDWNINPADDDAFAEAKTPGRNCEPIGGPKSDLSIQKEAKYCIQANLQDHAVFGCIFAITVKNEGPDPFFAPITVHDVYSPGLPSAPIFTPPGWTCGPAGGGYDCTYNPPAAIPMGGTVSLLTAAILPVNTDICRIDNSVKITSPPGGSDQNTNPTNDTASASLPVPARQCEPPPERKTNIKIEKVAGHCVAGGTPGATVAAIQPSVICNFGIKVSNTGPGNFNGVVGFLDAAQYGVAAISPLAAPGWICAQNAALSACVLNGSFPSGASATFTLKVGAPLGLIRQYGCKLPNVAVIKAPPVGPFNTIAVDDFALATAVLPANLCNQVEPAACPTMQVMPGGGCCPDGQIWNGRECSGGSVPKEKPTPICPAARAIPGGGCCPVGTQWNIRTKSCQAPQVCPSDRLIPGGGCCPGGTKWNPQTQSCQAPQFCPSDRLIPGGGCCPGGTKWNPRANSCQQPQSCPTDRLMPGGGCCPGGTKWNPKTQSCQAPQLCPSDRLIPGGGCCPAGTRWNIRTQSCQAPQVCPSDRLMPSGGCCPAGTKWNLRTQSCQAPQAQCPSDSIPAGTGCRCKQGTQGDPGHCKSNPVLKPAIVAPQCPSDSVPAGTACRCKPPTTGKPGNCQLLIFKPTLIKPLNVAPQGCPTGTTGKPPNCVQDIR